MTRQLTSRLTSTTMALCALLLAGCATHATGGDNGGSTNKGVAGEAEWSFYHRPAPQLADYQALAMQVMDGIASLSTRFECLAGMNVPDNDAAPSGVRYQLQHHADDDAIELEVQLLLGAWSESRAALPITCGQLTIVIFADGPQGEAVAAAIRELITHQFGRFVVHFDVP
ncbi:MAG: hypothetical protein AB7K09_05835 [Planctomycetota bacterium]